MKKQTITRGLQLAGLLLIVYICPQGSVSRTNASSSDSPELPIGNFCMVSKTNKDTGLIQVAKDVLVKDYFPFLDSLVATLNSVVDYPLTEHLLVWANPWIIDTLVNTDYYRQLSRGIFVYDQRMMVVLHQGDTLRVPDSEEVYAIQRQLDQTSLDVNIPEFKLRIKVADSVLHSFPVRVGQNERKYLKTAGHVVDLRTPVGEGKIIRVERNPYFVDPASGKSFSTTQRDDGRRTLMPQIPWLEPEINGTRFGTLIHPTTNPRTLEKAYSNGCVGTSEGAAWIIYYHAPVGTVVGFRYDLQVVDEHGNTIWLDDIYRLGKNPSEMVIAYEQYTQRRGLPDRQPPFHLCR